MKFHDMKYLVEVSCDGHLHINCRVKKNHVIHTFSIHVSFRKSNLKQLYEKDIWGERER